MLLPMHPLHLHLGFVNLQAAVFKSHNRFNNNHVPFFYCETCTSVCRKEVYEALLEHLRCLQEIRTQEYVGMSVCQRYKQTFLLKFQTTSKHLLTAV